MDRASAKARLARMVAADVRPVLDDAALEDLLDQGQVQDAVGLWPTDTGWTETYDLNASALEGWRWKAAQVAADFTFSADGASYDKGAVLANIEKMVALYQSKTHGVVTVKGRVDDRNYDWTALLP